MRTFEEDISTERVGYTPRCKKESHQLVWLHHQKTSSGRVGRKPGFPLPILSGLGYLGCASCLFCTPRFLCLGGVHAEPSVGPELQVFSVSLNSFPEGPVACSPSKHGWRHVTSSFLYKLSTCHPAVCFSLLRFSSNYVDFLHPTPSWKLIRLNIFIYYHFAQLLPAFPITLPASL